MRPEAETAALLALLDAGKRPGNAYSGIVEDAGSAIAILEAEQGLLAHGLLEPAARDLAAWSEEGIRVLTVLDPDYPANLRAVHDRPPLVFLAGLLEPRDARSVAVIGTRHPSEEGLARANAISERLVDTGYTVVSGLAAGIDTAAHSAALAKGGRTLAVIGTGLHRSYPPENAALQAQIASRCGVISQFSPDAGPTRQSFPLRNGTMSGLALATVVIEAGERSGARVQARLALGHGRPVLLDQALLGQQWAREFSTRPGTYVVRSPAEVPAIVEQLGSPTLAG